MRWIIISTYFYLEKTNTPRKINRHSDGNLDIFCPIVFAANQQQNEYYMFKDMLLQPVKSDFILDIIKEVEAH